MSRLSQLPYSDGISKLQQVRFGGLNHTKGASDGEVFAMKNITAAEYPVLGARMLRKQHTQGAINGLFGHEKLVMVKGTSLYYGGERMGTVANSKKQFAALGGRIVIWPDKVVLNVKYQKKACYATLAALKQAVTSPKELDAYGVGTAAPYEIYVYAGGSWQSNGKELQAIEQSVSASSLTFQNGTYHDEVADANTIYNASIRWADYFKEGDAVTISGCTAITANNKTPIIRELDGHYMRFYENTFTLQGTDGLTDYTESGSLQVARTAPELEMLCTNDNRIWGVQNDTIYCCKLGDPMNWNCFEGLSTDSFFVESGTPGKINACCSYLGYPTFFKEQQIIKVYGTKASNFQTQASAAMGAVAGAQASLAVAGDLLLYLARTGPAQYAGGVPDSIAAAFGKMTFTSAVAGSDGRRYYCSAKVQDGSWGLYVYDTAQGLWWQEDALQADCFAWAEGRLYCADAAGTVWILNEEPAAGEAGEEIVDSCIQFADFVVGSMNRKVLTRLQLRFCLNAGSTLKVLVQYDDDTQWTTVKTVTANAARSSYYLPVQPHRCERYRLRLEATGGWRLFGLAQEGWTGSELH